MFTEKQLGKYADVLLWGLKKARTKKYKKKDVVTVRYNLAALRLAEILQARLLDMGLNPMLRMLATSEMELIVDDVAMNRTSVGRTPNANSTLRISSASSAACEPT